MSRTIFALTIMILTFTTGAALAASFNCDKATTVVENWICSNPDLSKSDDEMSIVYSKLLRKIPNPSWLKQQQRNWLEQNRNRCADRACLDREYKARIVAVNDYLRLLDIKSEGEVCNSLVGLISSESDEAVVVPPITFPSDSKLKEIFGNEIESEYAKGYWSTDLNEDEIPDHLFFWYEDEYSFAEGAYVRSGVKGAKVFHFDEENAFNISLIRLGRGNYVYAYRDRAWKLNAKGNLQQICKFAYTGKYAVEITLGEEASVCATIKAGARLEYINRYHFDLSSNQPALQGLAFDQAHNLPPSPEEEFSILDGMAIEDIDNDGSLDNVIRIESHYKGRLPCSATNLAVIDANRNNILNTKLNTLLTEQLGGRCKPSYEAIMFRGDTYIHILDSANTIYRIKKGEPEKVCEFKIHYKYTAQ